MKLGHRPELDGLRAVAILPVVGFHLLKPMFPGGFLGISVFFVLSGYLITSLLIREHVDNGRIDYRGFLVRRARRLMPALAVLVSAYVLLAPLLWPSTVAERRWFDSAVALSYVTNLREALVPFNTPLSHTWTLGIEEQFYLLWPLALPMLLRLPRPRPAGDRRQAERGAQGIVRRHGGGLAFFRWWGCARTPCAAELPQVVNLAVPWFAGRMKQPADSKTYRTITEYAVLLAVVGLGLLALDALTHGALYHLGLVALAKSADLGR